MALPPADDASSAAKTFRRGLRRTVAGHRCRLSVATPCQTRRSTCGSNWAGPGCAPSERQRAAQRIGRSLDRPAGDPVDIYADGRLIARGELVVLDGNRRPRGGTDRGDETEAEIPGNVRCIGLRA